MQFNTAEEQDVCDITIEWLAQAPIPTIGSSRITPVSHSPTGSHMTRSPRPARKTQGSFTNHFHVLFYSPGPQCYSILCSVKANRNKKENTLDGHSGQCILSSLKAKAKVSGKSQRQQWQRVTAVTLPVLLSGYCCMCGESKRMLLLTRTKELRVVSDSARTTSETHNKNSKTALVVPPWSWIELNSSEKTGQKEEEEMFPSLRL